jgi:hypothetical protein
VSQSMCCPETDILGACATCVSLGSIDEDNIWLDSKTHGTWLGKQAKK